MYILVRIPCTCTIHIDHLPSGEQTFGGGKQIKECSKCFSIHYGHCYNFISIHILNFKHLYFCVSGEQIIEHTSDVLFTQILVNPQIQTVCNGLKKFLLSGSTYRQMIYAGHAMQGTGAWVLQDDVFTFNNFVHVFRETDVENALRKQSGGTLNLQVFEEGEWKNEHVKKQDFAKLLQINVNPDDCLSEISGVLQFTAYVSYFVKVKSPQELLQSSEVVGNIRFSKPTLYIFPGCQGDSALFGVSGFNLLVNGGYSRKACFWDFTRHLDRIDALLLTHLGIDNLFGISNVIQRKVAQNAHPEIGFVYFNAAEKHKHSPNGDSQPEADGSLKPASLMVSLIDEADRLVSNMRHLGHPPHPCTRHISEPHITPVNLYHKVGHGSLDMYILNPVDGKELKDFYQQWNKQVNNFSSEKSALKPGDKSHHIPLPNMMSVCALLVWKPSNSNANINRILFPGSVPQHKIFEGLEKVKHLDIFKYPQCTAKSLHTKTPARKTSAGISKPSRTGNGAPGVPKQATPKSIEKKPKPAAEPKKKEAKSTAKATPVKESPAVPVMRSPVKQPSEEAHPKVEEPPVLNEEPITNDVLVPQVNGGAEVSGESTPRGESPPPAEPPADLLVDTGAPGLPNEQPATANLLDFNEPPEDIEGEMLQPDMAATQEPAKTEPVEAWPDMQAPEAQHLDSPEPLPDPTQFDATGFEMAAPPVVEDTKEAVVYGDKIASDEKDIDTCVEPQTDDVLLTPYTSDVAQTESQVAVVEETESKECPDAQPALDDKQAEAAALAIYDTSSPEEVYVIEDDLKAKVDTQESAPEKADDIIEQGESTDQITAPEEVVSDVIDETKRTVPDAGADDEGEDKEIINETPIIYGKEPEESIEVTTEGIDGVDEMDKDSGVQSAYIPNGGSQQISPDEPEIPTSVKQEGDKEVEYEEVEDEEQTTPIEVQECIARVEPEEQVNKGEMAQVVPEADQEDPEQQQQSVEKSQAPDELAAEPEMTEDDVVETEPGKVDKFEAKESEVKVEDFPTEDVIHESQHVAEGDEGKVDEMDEEESISKSEHDVDDKAQDDHVPDNQEGDEEDGSDAGGLSTPEQDDELPVVTGRDGPEVQTGADEDDDEGAKLEGGEMEQEIKENVLEQDDDIPVMEAEKQRGENVDEESDGPLKEMVEACLAGPSDEQCDVPVSQDEVVPGNIMTESMVDSPAVPDGGSDDETPATAPIQGEDPSTPGDDNVLPDDESAEESSQKHLLDSEVMKADIAVGGANSMLDGEHGPPPDLLVSQKQQDNSPTIPVINGFDQNKDMKSEEFDPVKSWGEPMGLPAPPPDTATPPEKAKTKSTTKTKKTTTTSSFNKPTASSKSRAAEAPTKGDSKKTASAVKEASDKKKPSSSRPARPTSSVTSRNKVLDNKETEAKKRPATAPTKTETVKRTTKPPPRKPGGVPSRVGTERVGSKAGSPVGHAVPPIYLDLTYVPMHGSPNYCDVDFFKRIRARYYVFSGLHPSPNTLNALLEAKQTWNEKDLEVTIIPTYDTDTLRHWMGLHRDQLSLLKIDVAPSASRCTIQLQDHEASCAAYRLEF